MLSRAPPPLATLFWDGPQTLNVCIAPQPLVSQESYVVEEPGSWLYRSDATWPVALFQQTAHWLWQQSPLNVVVFSSNTNSSLLAIDELLDSLHTLALLSCIGIIDWYISACLWTRYWKQFRVLLPHQQWFVVYCASTALNLGLICVSPSFASDVYDLLVTGLASVAEPSRAMWIKRLCMLYASSSVVSLTLLSPRFALQRHVIAILCTLLLCSLRFSTVAASGDLASAAIVFLLMFGAGGSIAFPVYIVHAVSMLITKSIE